MNSDKPVSSDAQATTDLAQLSAEVDALTSEAGMLHDEVERDLAASQARFELARDVVPLRVKDGLGPPDAFDTRDARDRYIASLRRRRIRLQREGRAIAERLAEITRHAENIRLARADLSLQHTALRFTAGRSLDSLRAADAHRRAVLEWAERTAAQRRETIDWASRLVRLGEAAEKLPPPPARVEP